jgi:hypothetical protein
MVPPTTRFAGPGRSPSPDTPASGATPVSGQAADEGWGEVDCGDHCETTRAIEKALD